MCWGCGTRPGSSRRCCWSSAAATWCLPPCTACVCTGCLAWPWRPLAAHWWCWAHRHGGSPLQVRWSKRSLPWCAWSSTGVQWYGPRPESENPARLSSGAGLGRRSGSVAQQPPGHQRSTGPNQHGLARRAPDVLAQTLDHVDPVGRDQRQPMADVVLAAAEGGAADRTAETLRRQPGTEGARMLGTLDRLEHLDGHRLLRGRIAPRHVEPRGRALHRHGGAVLALQVRAPAGDVGEVAAVHGVLLCIAGHYTSCRAEG